MPPIALTIAGSDPSGGAGIQADLKTFHQFGVYGEAVIALLTVQNTVRVSRVVVMPSALVLEQLAAVLEDIPPAAAKTGALGSAEMVEAVARAARDFTFPVVVDPVMVSKHGVSLLPSAAVAAIRELLLPRAFLITPNVPEAEALTGMEILTLDDMRRAACRLLELGARAVLLKGGHLEGDATDLLFDGDHWHQFRSGDPHVGRHAPRRLPPPGTGRARRAPQGRTPRGRCHGPPLRRRPVAPIPCAAGGHAAYPRHRLHLLRGHHRRPGPRTGAGRRRGGPQTLYPPGHSHQPRARQGFRTGQPSCQRRVTARELASPRIVYSRGAAVILLIKK